MKQIDEQIGSLLFDRVEEIISNPRFAATERIPKYRTILDDLFKVLTADAKQYFCDLHGKTVFIFREFNIDTDIQNKTNSLRNFSNRVVHESGFVKYSPLFRPRICHS